jgi:hypothetical protein
MWKVNRQGKAKKEHVFFALQQYIKYANNDCPLMRVESCITYMWYKFRPVTTELTNLAGEPVNDVTGVLIHCSETWNDPRNVGSLLEPCIAFMRQVSGMGFIVRCVTNFVSYLQMKGTRDVKVMQRLPCYCHHEVPRQT